MGRTFVRQDTQIRKSDAYTDNVAPTLANYETNPVNIEDDLNNVRSQLHNLLEIQAGNWYDDLNVPATLDTGAKRGVNNLNTDLHAVERKRVLRDVYRIGGVTVGGSDDFVILALAELPANTTAAIGAVTTLGTVGAYSATFGAASLDEVAGGLALSPLNLMNIVDSTTRDPILSGARKVYGLFQTESNTDGSTMTGTTPNRAQISFVRQNAAGTDLELVPAADIQGKVIAYSTRERVPLESLNEEDFLNGAVVDIGGGSVSVTRGVGYTNQGTTPVDLVTNATLDLEGAGLAWLIRDDLEASLFGVVEGSAGGTSQVNIYSDVDEFDVDAAVNNFLNGISVDTGAAGTTINVGVTANQIDSGGALAVQSAAATDLTLFGQNELILNDGNMTSEVTWTGPGVKVTDTTAEVTAYETAFGGEVSLFNAIVQAASAENRDKTVAVVTTTTVADTDVGGTAGGTNLDAQLGDYSGVTFLTDVDIFLNGVLLRNGADAAANHDVYPGTSAALGQLKFEFSVKGTGIPDVLTMIIYGV